MNCSNCSWNLVRIGCNVDQEIIVCSFCGQPYVNDAPLTKKQFVKLDKVAAGRIEKLWKQIREFKNNLRKKGLIS